MRRCELGAYQCGHSHQQEAFHRNLPARILPLQGRVKEAIVGVVCVFDLVLITQIREEAFESLVLIRRDFERCQNPAEIRTVVSVMEEADVPSAAERVEELKQGPRPLRELETAEALAPDVTRMAADHIPHVKLRQFVVGEVGRYVALAKETGFDLVRVLAAAN